jgi:hypothetical protein
MTLIKRSEKGEALTYQEMDGNLTHLGGDGSYVAPTTDGNPGQILATDGNGQLYFTYAGTGDTLAIRDDDGNETGINLGGDALSILGGNGIKTHVPQDSSQSVVISIDEDFLIQGTFRANQINAPIVGNDSTLLVDVVNSSVPWSVINGTPTTLVGYGITDAFDGAYGSLTGAPTNVSAFTNDAGYLTTISSIIDIKGSVFGDDSTVLVDGVGSRINLDGTVKGNIIPDQNEQYDLGSATNKFRDLYLSTGTIYLGAHKLSIASGSLHLNDSDISTTVDYSSIQNRVVNLSDLANVGSTAPTTGQVLKWDGAQWAPGEDISIGGEGLDATTLGGFAGTYYLNYNNFTNVPTNLSTFTNDSGYLSNTHWNIVGDDSAGTSINNTETLKVTGSNNITTSVSEINNNTILNISGPTALSDFTNDANFITGASLNVIQNTASGGGSLSYNSNTRIFTYTPPDLSSIESPGLVKLFDTSWSNGPGSVTISNTYVNSTYTKYILYVDTLHGSQGGTVYLDINKTGGGHTMTLFSNTGNESSDWHFAEVHISYDVYIRAWAQALSNTEGGGGYTNTSSISGHLSAGGTPSSITLRSPNSGLNSGALRLYGVKS